MKLTTISVTYGRKLNLGDYNSAHIETSLWAELEEGDDPAIAAEALRTMARNQVMVEMSRINPKLEAKVKDIFMGLPTNVQKQVEQEWVDDSNDRHYDNGGDPMNFGDS